MLIAAIVLGLVCLPSGDVKTAQTTPKGLFSQVFKDRTYTNGYEEYVMAADVLDHASYELNDLIRACTETPGNVDRLELQRKLVKLVKPALELIREGNKKPVKDPRPVQDPFTPCPELEHFRTLGRLLSIVDANVCFADGRARTAVDDLLVTMQFGRNVGRCGGLTGYMASVEVKSAAFAGFDQLFDRVPQVWLQHISQMADDALADKPVLAKALLADFKASRDNLVRAIEDQDRNPAPGEPTTNEQDPFARIASMTAEQRRDLAASAARVLDQVGERVQALLSETEANWVHADRTVMQIVSNQPDLTVRALVESFAPALSQTLSAGARERTQLRLLKLHTLIQDYRWNSGRLPKNLDQLRNDEAAHDPLTGKRFIYTSNGKSYELFSEGTPELGRIDMRYRRDAGSSHFDPAVVSP